jgi:hypothetical protein
MWTDSVQRSICFKYFFFNFFELGETESTWYVGHYFGQLYQPQVIDDMCGAVGGM